ncbi:MAG: hypothetical protein J6A01_11105 [Proteobacteria bacterium]|nr:hypothetical protein [Pseudomonadota bacterium]
MACKGGFALSLLVLLALGMAGCTDDGGEENDCGGLCAVGQKCDVKTNLCYVPCGALRCATNEICDPVTMLCTLPSNCNNCNGLCGPTQTCDAAACICRENSVVCNNCNGTCTPDQICNPSTCQCDPKPVECNNCNGTCGENQTCDSESCTCQDNPVVCDNCNGECRDDQTCDIASCTCQDNPVVCDNCGGKCRDDQTCDIASCTCQDNPVVCDNCDGKCTDKQVCNTSSCKCEPKPVDPGKCEFVKNCNEKYETWDEEKCDCVNTACIGKTWDPEVCYCSITGKLWKHGGEIPCDEETSTECEEKPENVVVNWSFEDWTNDIPDNWSLYNNAFSQAGSLNKVTDPKSCEYAVLFANPSKKVARIEGDPIMIPEKTYSGGNLKLKCTAWVKGIGKVNLGYRGLNDEGKDVSAETMEDKKTASLTGAPEYKKMEFTASFGNSVAFQPLIGLRSVDDSTISDTAITVDDFECVVEDTLCTGISCEHDWEICDIANHKDENDKYIGLCIPREGFCDVTKDADGKVQTLGCKTTESCDLTTHTCRREDGKCDSNTDCPDDSKPVCNTTSHECEAGDPCAKAKCSEWKECTVASRGKCVLKEGRCDNLFDCMDKSAPACYGAEHRCVSEDFVYPVAKKNECPLGEYFKMVNGDNKDLICPVNIVPNGSFEDWEEVDITSKTKAHLPVWWYAMEGDFVIYPSHYVSEIPYSALKEYSAAPHSGKKALQVEYTKAKAERFSSLGFDVPGKTYDCVYWVRGKGELRMHWYGSRGEASKAMVPANGEFIQYDTTEWTREKFVIKNAQSDLRLVFYVGRTDAGKDHIQIDDVICTERVY